MYYISWKIIALEKIVIRKVLQCIDSQQISHNNILPVKYADMLGIKTVVKNYDFATRNVQSFKTMWESLSYSGQGGRPYQIHKWMVIVVLWCFTQIGEIRASSYC